MNTIDVEQKVKSFLADRLLIEFGEDVTEDSDLFQLGLIDSQSYIELIRFIEREFDLRLTNEQILSNVFASVSGMVSLIANGPDQAKSRQADSPSNI